LIVDMLKPAMEEIVGAGVAGTVDIMGAIVDMFEEEGVKHVFNGGLRIWEID
jgi:hypothetical protein